MDVDWKGKKILVVDDEPDLRELIAFEFDMQGASVMEAPSGNKAISILSGNNFDGVVTDIRMPDGDGIQLLDHLAKRDRQGPKPPVVFISGFADISFEDAYERGAEAILTKPFDLRELVAAVRKCLTPWEHRLQSTAQVPAPKKNYHRKFESLEAAIKSGSFNVGWGGCYIESVQPFPYPGELIQLTVEFESGPAPLFEVIGVVRWSRKEMKANLKPGLGIEIIHLSAPAPDVLSSLLQAAKITSFIPKT